MKLAAETGAGSDGMGVEEMAVQRAACLPSLSAAEEEALHARACALRAAQLSTEEAQVALRAALQNVRQKRAKEEEEKAVAAASAAAAATSTSQKENPSLRRASKIFMSFLKN